MDVVGPCRMQGTFEPQPRLLHSHRQNTPQAALIALFCSEIATPKQLIPEWMEERHFVAAEARGMFANLPDHFVGTHDELAQLMTAHGLRRAMVDVFQHAGRSSADGTLVPPPARRDRRRGLP